MAMFATITLLLLLFTVVPVFSDNDTGTNSTTSPTKCSSNLGSGTNQIPFNTSALICNSVWSPKDFTLLYQKGGDNTWNFVLTAPDTNAYIGIGFSNNGRMVGSSAVVGWISASGKGIAKQYFLGGKTGESCTPDKGYLALGKTSMFKQASTSRLYLAFQINVTDTTQPKSNLIYAVGPAGVLPGSDSLLTIHDAFTSTTIDYASGQSVETSSDTLQTAHGLLGLIGWGVVVPIGVLVARYGKRWDPQWFYTHLVVQFLGFGLGVAAIITGFKLEDQTGDEVDTHKAIGIVILVLGALQVMAFLARPDKLSKVRKYWNWYHHNVGRAAIILAIANIFYGLNLASEDKSWSIGFGVFLGLWVLLALIFEALSFRGNNKN